MTQAADMFRAHPRQSQIEFSVLAKCVDECYACAQASTTCADACLGEANVADLVRCIRLNEDCRAACQATGEMLPRVTEADWTRVLPPRVTRPTIVRPARGVRSAR
ncbi:MAG: hypothetical protein M9914_11345 [Trueperaceae bacterium]|nr:hypothetical protein [Trueperaceae bacterium]